MSNQNVGILATKYEDTKNHKGDIIDHIILLILRSTSGLHGKID